MVEKTDGNDGRVPLPIKDASCVSEVDTRRHDDHDELVIRDVSTDTPARQIAEVAREQVDGRVIAMQGTRQRGRPLGTTGRQNFKECHCFLS